MKEIQLTITLTTPDTTTDTTLRTLEDKISRELDTTNWSTLIEEVLFVDALFTKPKES